MKFLQIAVASDSENGEGLFALGDDGNIYERFATFYRAGSTYDGKKVKRAFYSPFFWRKVDLPFAEPKCDPEEMKDRLE
jgi:hypothetical protein